MGEPSRKEPSRALVRCLYCGTEQVEIALPGGASCIKCARPLASADPEAPGPPSTAAPTRPQRAPRPRPLGSARIQTAMDGLIAAGPMNEGMKAAGEVVEIQKRGMSLAGVIPIIGPWLIRDSEALSREEKRKLSAISITITIAIAIAIWTQLPSAADQAAVLRQRIDANMQELVAVAESFRKDHGVYPDAATWRRFAARADARFFDPWARPYLYEPSRAQVTIGTLGRDGVAGGESEDADVSRDFPAPGASTTTP